MWPAHPDLVVQAFRQILRRLRLAKDDSFNRTERLPATAAENASTCFPAAAEFK
jgi:hypothetical protein